MIAGLLLISEKLLLKQHFIISFFFLLFTNFPVFSQQQTAHITKDGIKYLVYLPQSYTNDKKPSPLLLFLHGLGEKGENIESIKRYGPPQLIEKGDWSKDLPFVVISPQLPGKFGYWPDNLVTDIIRLAEQNYNIDSQRIYLTGLSLGGMGTWNYAIHHAERLAAIIPISGKADPTLACKLGTLPVWAFHGAKDRIVSPQGSIKMVSALRNCKERENSSTKLTVYPDLAHDCWSVTYENQEIYKWLLGFKNKNAIPLDKVTPPVNSNNDKANIEDNGNIFKTICSLPAALVEVSGLEFYGNGLIWANNDGGNLPYLFQIDTTGKIIQTKRITKAANFDWEDLAKDGEGNLYIGDFGNNNNKRRSFQIYKIPNPEKTTEERISAELIEFSLEDQHAFPPKDNQLNFDIEAMITFNDHIYLFTKNRTRPFSGYVKRYKLPVTPGKYKAELIDSAYLDKGGMFQNWVTGADISPDKKSIVLLTSNKVWLLRNFKEDNFFSGDIIPIQLPTLTQKEGITFINNTEILISDELFKNFIGGKLYRLDISSFMHQ